MSLTLEVVLHGVAATLRDRIAPALDDSFASEAARLAAMLITISANAVDDAAAVRVWENAALRALFGDAQDMVGPNMAGDLGDRLAQAVHSSDPGLRISELDEENNRLRTLLVELHEAVETMEGEGARAVDARIWQILRETVTRRAPQS